jgi:septum formation protein
MPLILASQSPRRKELLSTLGVTFSTLPADIDETPFNGEIPSEYVIRMAKEKALATLKLAGEPLDTHVLGSDTSVIVNGIILGKPETKSNFVQMMQMLSGTVHEVMTSIALVSHEDIQTQLVTTQVYFIPLNEEMIDQYWQTGEPKDKAGGYGIQGFGSVFVEKISGSYSAVVGLPLHETAKILSKAGLPIWAGALLL